MRVVLVFTSYLRLLLNFFLYIAHISYINILNKPSESSHEPSMIMLQVLCYNSHNIPSITIISYPKSIYRHHEHRAINASLKVNTIILSISLKLARNTSLVDVRKT